MSKTNFKQADVERGLKAVKAQAMPVSCVQIGRDGTIQIIIGDPMPARALADVNESELNEWDVELNK